MPSNDDDDNENKNGWHDTKIHDEVKTNTTGESGCRAATKLTSHVLTQLELWQPKLLPWFWLLMFRLDATRRPSKRLTESSETASIVGRDLLEPPSLTCPGLPIWFITHHQVSGSGSRFTSCHNMWVRSTMSCKFAQLWDAWMHSPWCTGRRDLLDVLVYPHQHHMWSPTLAS